MAASDIERLVQLLAKLPGLGPRSARRAVLYLLKRREAVMVPLVQAMSDALAGVKPCSQCGNLDDADPCVICLDPRRDASLICVVQDVADLWALERSGVFCGRYHVLGGTLSALDGVGPDDLNIAGLLERASRPEVSEIVLALSVTVDGQTTAHYLCERLSSAGVAVTQLAHGLPMGGELDYLDEGTLQAALRSRRPAAGD